MMTPDAWIARIGTEIALSDWVVLDQARIDAFAACTEDHQFIHTDPARAAATPFGGTVAHGFLTLSMLSKLAQALPPVAGMVMGVNAGFDRVRFVSPVRAGQSVRGRFVLAGVERPAPEDLRLRLEVSVEIDGSDRPALVATWLVRMVLGRG
jgi:acyl dehydratase